MIEDGLIAGTTRLDKMKEAVLSFDQLLTQGITAPDDEDSSTTPYKLVVARQALFWRTKEIAEGVISALETQNWLAAAILGRSLMETVSFQVEITRIVQQAGSLIPPSDLEHKVSRILRNTRETEQSINRLALLDMVNKVDKAVENFRNVHATLGEYITPSIQNTLMLFSDHRPNAGSVNFQKYARGTDGLETACFDALKLSLFASIHFLGIQMNHMQSFREICDTYEQKVLEEQRGILSI